MTALLPPDGTRPDLVRTTEVADGVFAYLQEYGGWCVNNAGVLLDDGDTTVIDTVATQARAEALREAVGQLAALPPRLVVNTHFHGDHTFGNGQVAGQGTLVVAHEHARVEMAEAGLGMQQLWPHVGWGAVEVLLPHLTYRDRLTLHTGRRAVQLLHVGPAHTRGDTVVWLPEDRVLFAGDVAMARCTPFVLMGSVRGSLRALDRLRALQPRTVVGGHGALTGPEVFDEVAGYLRWVLGLAREARAAGLGPLEAARETDLGAYGDWLDPERLVGNLHRAYAELDGRPEGEPLEVVRVFGEMVEYNEGRLPDCFA